MTSLRQHQPQRAPNLNLYRSTTSLMELRDLSLKANIISLERLLENSSHTTFKVIFYCSHLTYLEMPPPSSFLMAVSSSSPGSWRILASVSQRHWRSKIKQSFGRRNTSKLPEALRAAEVAPVCSTQFPASSVFENHGPPELPPVVGPDLISLTLQQSVQ